MGSIRTFLLLVIAATVVLVLFIATMQGYRAGLAQTGVLLDDQLREKSQLLSAGAAPNESADASDQLFQIFNAAGQVIARSDNAPAYPLTLVTDAPADISAEGELWRVLGRRDDYGNLIIVAERALTRHVVAEDVVSQTLVPIVLGLPILLLLIGAIVTFGLRHLRLLTQQLRQRSPNNLEPLETQSLPDEIRPVIESMNTLFGRVESSFDREKRFASDAAHELRTPVSALKVNLFNLEKKLSGGDNDLDAVADNLDRMGHLIEQLLLLYRTSSEQLRLQFESVNLLALCQQTVGECYPKIQERNQDIELDGDDVNVMGNVFALSAMIKNLVDNASKYTPEGGQIRLSLSREGEGATLVVEDSGLGIPEAMRARVTERFFRINRLGGQRIGGCGLGLSIVKHVLELHGARLDIGDSRFETGTRVAVWLPDNLRAVA